MLKATCNPVIPTSFLPLFVVSSVNLLHGFIRRFIFVKELLCV